MATKREDGFVVLPALTTERVKAILREREEMAEREAKRAEEPAGAEPAPEAPGASERQ